MEARMPHLPEFIRNHKRNGLDPVAELLEASSRTPLARNPEPGILSWVATGRDEVRAILADATRFSTRPPADSEEASRLITQPGNPLQYDPPDHTRLRKMMAPEFTVHRMRRMEPLIERLVRERLDVLERAGSPADLMRHFAWPLPGLVGCTLLGVPRDDQSELVRHMDLSRRDHRSWQQRQASANAFDGYLLRFIRTKRRNPGDDMLGTIMRDYGDEVSDKELVGFCASLLAAGLENMAAMIGLGILALLEHPDQLALLRREPGRMDRAVEELLRYLAVVPIASPRTAVRDVPIGDQVIKAGEIVSCSLLAVNRAQRDDTAADGLDITREGGGPHMAFGHGVHFCAGAALARLELKIAYAGVLDRFPELSLAVPAAELRFRPPQLAAFGVEQLPIAW
jgi:cytochrome P450